MFNIPRTALVLVLLHVLLPKLAEKSVVIHVTFFFSWNKSCATTAAIGDFRLTQHTNDWFHLMWNFTPSWVLFHFCIHRSKLKHRLFCSLCGDNTLGQEDSSTYHELFLDLAIHSIAASDFTLCFAHMSAIAIVLSTR